MADPVDHFWTSMGQKFDGKALKSLTQGEADLSAIPAEGEPEPEPKPDDVAAHRFRAEGGTRRCGCRRRARIQAAGHVGRVPRGRRRRRPGPGAGAPAPAPEARRGLQARARDQSGASADQGARGRDCGRAQRARPATSGICCSTRRWSWKASCRPTRPNSPNGSTDSSSRGLGQQLIVYHHRIERTRTMSGRPSNARQRPRKAPATSPKAGCRTQQSAARAVARPLRAAAVRRDPPGAFPAGV